MARKKKPKYLEIDPEYRSLIPQYYDEAFYYLAQGQFRIASEIINEDIAALFRFVSPEDKRWLYESFPAARPDMEGIMKSDYGKTAYDIWMNDREHPCWWVFDQAKPINARTGR